MKKHDFLIYITVLLFIEGYLFTNILPLSFGIIILFYLFLAMTSFNPLYEYDIIVPEMDVIENEKIVINLKIKNLSTNPLNFKITENSSEFEWSSKKKMIKSGTLSEIKLELKPIHKGCFLINEIPLKISDQFDIFEKVSLINTSLTINVYPSNERILNGLNMNKNIKLGTEILKSLKMGHKSSEFDYLRDYFPGDEFKNINWKASLKFGRLISKEFLKENEGNLTILVDVSQSFLKDFKGGNLKTDYVSMIVFQIAFYALKNYKFVNMVFFDDSGIVKFAPNITSKQSLKKYLKNRLVPSEGTPYIQNSPDRSSEKPTFLRILKPILKRSPEKFFHVTKLIDPKSTPLLITDISNIKQILTLHHEICKKNSKMYIISPNPLLFGIDEISENRIPIIYNQYIEREKNLFKLNKLCPTVDVGPNDLLKEILEEFK
ncbi:protein of unknown function DUF58 [Methanococcus maripaludis C5]|uniref:DUF58 domain-containing protein n=1 Tax=Methanococcus maripaludis (strain C5 / ATCC BAA-1333) TaxID=402880 RepID=A4FZI8_METM5|nr:DUF58 domain-containing protein [Methanococcus maripaludis]ABO35622.1 protein of unknown function DUF58 [Methanococcus maripaludis C5]